MLKMSRTVSCYKEYVIIRIYASTERKLSSKLLPWKRLQHILLKLYAYTVKKYAPVT